MMISCWKSTTVTERRKERETEGKRRRRRMGVSKYSTALALTPRQVPTRKCVRIRIGSGFNCVRDLVQDRGKKGRGKKQFLCF
jgi:hypothetical protein